MEDSQIIALYMRRDEQAIAETAKKYAVFCHSIAFRVLGNHADAEEAVNDAYLGTWNSIPPNRPQSFSAYIGKITRRLALTMWRDSHREKRGGSQADLALEELESCIPGGTEVESVLEKKELTQCISQFVEALPTVERRVFMLRYWHLYSIGEIGKMYHFSESKVKSMLRRTRLKLQEHLLKEGVL